MADDEGFIGFAEDVAAQLLRSAVLLTGDRYLAEDLVQDTLARMYRIWGGISRIDNPAAYAHTVLTREFLTSRRRRSSTERPSAHPADTADPTVPDTELRVSLVAALAELPKRDRAVLVLRFLCDRSVEQVAVDLGRSPSAITTQSMRALAKLRANLGSDLHDLIRP